MEITIEKEFKPEEFIESNLMLLKHTYRKTINISLTLSIVFLILVVWDQVSLGITFNKELLDTISGSFFISLLILVTSIVSKSKLKRNIIIQSTRIKGIIRYELSDHSISYSDNLTSLQYKWTGLTHFLQTNEYIIISDIFNVLPLKVFILYKTDIEARLLTELIEILRNNLIEK
nr:hypothetical protein [uncultured Carboxylicivirga sp.]